MCRLLMLEEHKAWKREFGFDRIETAAEMDEKRFRTSPVPDPFFYRNMSNPRRPHTPDEFTLEMKVDVERLRIEIIFSQPAPPQYDPLPRRAAVDTGSEEPRTPRRSRAIGTGSDEPRVCCYFCFSHSAYWLPTPKNYFTRWPVPLVVC